MLITPTPAFGELDLGDLGSEPVIVAVVRRVDGADERTTRIPLRQSGARHESATCLDDLDRDCFVNLDAPPLSCNDQTDNEVTFSLEGFDDITVLVETQSRDVPQVCLWGPEQCFRLVIGSSFG